MWCYEIVMIFFEKIYLYVFNITKHAIITSFDIFLC